ncbi:MAG: zinc-binding alcohol dehydrogenase [Vicinamibacterales bacterium]
MTRAFWITAPGSGEIRAEPIREPERAQARVRTLYSGISRGTESLVFNGQVPVGERARMRAPFQEGDFPAPVKYGYSNVGVVEAGSDNLVGRVVFSLFPHQTAFVAPETALHAVPDEVPPERAVLASNMETALNGVWDSDAKPGDRIVVIGGGAVGCLAAWLAGRIPGTEVCLVDVNPARAGIAARLGVTFAAPAEAPAEADLVVHASGTSEGLERALQCAGFEATIVELSWFGARTVSLTLGGAFHARRLRIQSSQVGQVATVQRPRWDHARRLRLALSLLRAPELDALITGESAFEDLPRVMGELARGSTDAICHRIRY